MSSNTVNIPDEDAENCPPSESFSCTNNGHSTSNPPPPSIKPNSYMKRQRRRRKWWYFNRGLQPISELAEIKDVKDDGIKSENYDASPTIPDDSYAYTPTDNTIISTDSTQNKESYSACLKLIEKFQEVVMDSAVRVIQAAFKRFRERRRFLRIKKAVMVIQRNLRKWLETKHPCIRPADFERQTSDGAKSDEYRETVENIPEDCATEEKDDQPNNNESENSRENDTNGNENLVESNHLDNLQESTLDVEDCNAELELGDKTLNVEKSLCSSKCEEETIESNSSQEEKLLVTAESKQEEIVGDVKLLLEEMLMKVISNYSDSNLHENQPEESKNLTTLSDTTDICPSRKLTSEDDIETQGNPNIDVVQDELNLEKENYSKITSGVGFEDREEHPSIMSKISPDSLKGICQKFLDMSEISNLHNKELEAES